MGVTRFRCAMRDGHWVKIKPSRSLCGTSPEEFGDLLVRLAPLAEADKCAREDRAGRQRAPGAGRKPTVFAVRLLVGLTHLRQGTSVRATAGLFGVHERSVRRWRDELERLLVAHGVVPPGADEPVRTLRDLADYLRVQPDDSYVIVDGTDVPRPRPGSWEAQKPAWSGKSKRHAIKATVLADPDGNAVWFEANPTGEGRTQEIAALRAGALLGVLALAGITVLGDLGYQGLGNWTTGDVYTPVRRPRGRPHLDRDSRLYNHALAQARIRVEHSIAGLKRWGALRHHRRPPAALDRTGRAITVLNSLT
ncbi:MAG TPA: transposase family protein [Acidimicrobiales bacterium]|nr:transposase family protein [Acidimicrobiales bacterium]